MNLEYLKSRAEKAKSWHGDTILVDVEELTSAVDYLERYRWHDLRKNPNDLPNGDWDKKILCVVRSPIRFYERYHICHYVRGEFIGFYEHKKVDSGIFQTVTAWRYIEPFEEVEE